MARLPSFLLALTVAAAPVLLASANAWADGPVLTLAEAVTSARQRQPQLRQARANTAAAWARSDEARAPLLPQLTGTATYQRLTGNFAPRPGAVPSSLNMMGAATCTNLITMCSPYFTDNFWTLGLTLSQTLMDFPTIYRWRSTRSVAESQGSTEHATQLQVVLNVRTVYFNARAQKALVEVAQQTLYNLDMHLKQVEGQVKVGARPEIDLAQARSDRANGLVQLINAQNGYETAKVQLNQAMGVEGPTDYDVQDETLAPVPGEDEGIGPLLDEAIKARPDLLGLEQQIHGQRLAVSAAWGGYGPLINASTGVTAAGGTVDANGNTTGLVGNWNLTVGLTWYLFQGLLTHSQIKEAQANLVAIEAQRDGLRQQVRTEVDAARLQVRAAKSALAAADEALANARIRLKLAEGRYQAGVGSIIELGDAQVAATSSAAQRVQADYNLSTARASLLKALGRTT